MSLKNLKIAVIGTGNLGLSIINGLIESNDVENTNLYATKRNLDSIKDLKEEHSIHISNNNEDVIKEADLILFALKPHTILDELARLREVLTKDKTIVSLASGVNLEDIENVIPNRVVYRAMPNTASDVRESVTCLSYNSDNPEKLSEVEFVFNQIGETVVISEELMNSATVLGACGIAYVLRFIRGMIQGGIQIGFDCKTATKIATQTVKGATELLLQKNNHPEEEIDKVTTPKGCTIVGLNEMEHNGFSSALIKGIVTSSNAIND